MVFKKEYIARFGLGAMGFVYVLIGVLTALTTFNMGGQKVGTKGAIGFLSNQHVAKLLLAIMAIGLFSYAFWRFYQTFLDSRKLGKDMNALFVRAGYFTGGVFYGSLGVVALKLFFGGNYDNRQEVIVSILNSAYGNWLAVIIGLILAGKAIFEIYFVISNKFKRNVQSSKMEPKVKSVLMKFGVIGHLSRGAVFAIMSFLTIRTGVTIRVDEIGSITDAFQFMDYEFGAVVLGIVALGLLCFGLFMFVKARYLYIQMH